MIEETLAALQSPKLGLFCEMNKYLPPNIQQLAKGPIALANPAEQDIDSGDIFTS